MPLHPVESCGMRGLHLLDCLQEEGPTIGEAIQTANSLCQLGGCLRMTSRLKLGNSGEFALRKVGERLGKVGET